MKNIYVLPRTWISTRSSFLFDITRKLILDQEHEIYEIISIGDWDQTPWMNSSSLHDKAVNLSTAKDYQLDFPAGLRVHPQRRYRRTERLMILRRVQQPHNVKVHAVEHGETCFMIPQKPKKTNETPMQHGATCRMIWRNGWRNSLNIQWTKKLQHQAQHPQAFLVNHFIWHIREKWYRVSTASLLTSRKTEVAKYTKGQKLPGHLAEDALVIQYLELDKGWRLDSSRSQKSRQEPLQYCCNPAWMKSDGMVPWNVTVICETLKTSYRTGKHLMSEPFSGPLIPFGSTEYHPISANDQSRLRQVGKKVLLGIHREYALCAGVCQEGRHHGRRH